MIAPTSKSEQDQATRMPDEEKEKPKRRNSNAYPNRLQPQTTKWKKRVVPTNRREEGTKGRTSLIRKRQRKE
ncbi:hypothetical protein TNCV_658641 [Trichonephila clavipes]|uniref:Uncharacterized protein n=1 Tax=Trichonephila clavipes TaxID=2585209 RepID=A0A8X6T017_TRICX|nr:hypothetical protein TNCV_658641 [Trichonephila clavipes]